MATPHKGEILHPGVNTWKTHHTQLQGENTLCQITEISHTAPLLNVMLPKSEDAFMVEEKSSKGKENQRAGLGISSRASALPLMHEALRLIPSPAGRRKRMRERGRK